MVVMLTVGPGDEAGSLGVLAGGEADGGACAPVADLAKAGLGMDGWVGGGSGSVSGSVRSMTGSEAGLLGDDEGVADGEEGGSVLSVWPPGDCSREKYFSWIS